MSPLLCKAMQEKGTLVVDNQPRQLTQLKSKVENLIKIEQNTVVVIQADKVVSHGQVYQEKGG